MNRSRRPSGFRCTARARKPTTSARRRRFTIPTAPNRCGATRGRRSCTARCATSSATFRCSIFGDRMANIKSTAWIADSAVLAAERVPAELFLHLSAASRLRGAEVRPRQRSGQAGRRGARRRDWQAGRRCRRGARRAAAVDRGQRVRDRAGRSCDVSRIACCGCGACSKCETRPTASTSISSAARPGRWSIISSRTCFCADDTAIAKAAQVFQNMPGIAEVLVGPERAKYALDHERSGEIVLVSTPNSWQAYYWWLDDDKAPAFARTVDIHRKPGYDPVELFIDMPTRRIPLDASLVKGSHGAPALDDRGVGVIRTSQARYSRRRKRSPTPKLLRHGIAPLGSGEAIYKYSECNRPYLPRSGHCGEARSRLRVRPPVEYLPNGRMPIPRLRNSWDAENSRVVVVRHNYAPSRRRTRDAPRRRQRAIRRPEWL